MDFAAHPVASDRRLWSEDRIHANSAGHARIAEALAHALALPESNAAWSQPLPALPLRTTAQTYAAEARWLVHHLLPWIRRSLAGRSLADGRSAKRPALAPL